MPELSRELEKKRTFLKDYKLIQTKIKRLEEMADIYPDRAEHYFAQRDRCRKLRDKIEYKIENIKEEILSEILFQKYICAKTFEQISYELNYSRRQIERLHNKALAVL